MNVFHKVTRESLRKNRLRTIVTIVGVLLSAAMVCAVTTIVVSFQGFYRDSEVYETGDWYGRVERADQEVRQALEADSRVAHVASAEILGYAASESQNEDKPYIYLLGADATFFDVMPVRAVGETAGAGRRNFGPRPLPVCRERGSQPADWRHRGAGPGRAHGGRVPPESEQPPVRR